MEPRRSDEMHSSTARPTDRLPHLRQRPLGQVEDFEPAGKAAVIPDV
jgi:hypothetical protein